MNCEKQVRTTIRNRENNNKKKEILSEIWATFRWITEYLTLTTYEWEIEKQEREQEEKMRLENWNKLTRAEKIAQYKLENEPVSSHESVELHEKCEQQKTTKPSITSTKEQETPEISENKPEQQQTGEYKTSKNITRTIISKLLNSTQNMAENNEQNNAKQEQIVIENNPKNNIAEDITNELLHNILNIVVKTQHQLNNENFDQTKNEEQVNIIKPSKLLTMKQQKIENFFNVNNKQNDNMTNNTNNNKNKQTARNSPKTTPKQRTRQKQQENQKTVKQLRGFWTNFAREQMKRDSSKLQVKNETQTRTKTGSQSQNQQVDKQGENCQTDASIEVFDTFPDMTLITEENCDLLENSILQRDNNPICVIEQISDKSENLLLEHPKMTGD